MFGVSTYFTVIYFSFFELAAGYLDSIHGWNYLNLHCRDNENRPVEWWYIYKPPSDVVPYLEMGRNFTYITSSNAGQWQSSDKFITSNSMLQHTLQPIYRPTYVDYLAVAVYENHRKSDAMGVLMADEMGGVWIGHTVPGLVNINADRPRFPDREKTNGHLLMCLSVDLIAVNEIASGVRTVAPNFTYIKIPKRMDELLPSWNFLEPLKKGKKQRKSVKFLTSGNSMLVEILTRPPENLQCLYCSFAASKHIVLDVYGQTDSTNITTICNQDYGIRNIETISLTTLESVHNIGNMTDRAKFAVSTASPRQKLDSNASEYWTCTSNLDKADNSGKGGMITCVNDYAVWLTFDNLKIKEPEC